ncbi:hypothetical protein CYL16_12250 [Mycobacterium sp. EPG1]|nr:hypothetical protein CYL16_12250 [Mycobacterium sp. EPG1]
MTAYVPGLFEVGEIAESAIVAVDSILTSSMDVVLAVTSRIPLISALAPQISYVYFCVLRSFVYAPLIGAARFAQSLDFRYVVNAAVHVLDRLAYFVRNEINYFLNLPKYLFGFQFLPEEFRPTLSFGVLSSANVASAVDSGTLIDDDTDTAAESDVAPTGEQGDPGEVPAAVDAVVVDLPAEVPVLVEEAVTEPEIAVDVETISLTEEVDAQVEVVGAEEEVTAVEDDDSDSTLTDDLAADAADGDTESDTPSSGDVGGSATASTSVSEDKESDGGSDAGSDPAGGGDS